MSRASFVLLIMIVVLCNSTVKVSSRDIEDDQLTSNIKFGQGRAVDEARRSKLKEVGNPNLVFILLRVILLGIGVLGLKSWIALHLTLFEFIVFILLKPMILIPLVIWLFSLKTLQLSFFRFIVSVGMAIFQLCKKIAADTHAAPIAHGWEYQTQYRSFQDQDQLSTSQLAHNLAYTAHAQL